MTHYLMFESQQQAFEIAKELGYAQKDPDGNDVLVAYTTDRAIDEVGIIYKPTGVQLEGENGIKYPEMKAVSGWHWNMNCANLPEELTGFEVFPSTPNTIFCE